MHSTAKVSEEVNRKLPARNTTVQLLTSRANPERLNLQYLWNGARYHQCRCWSL